MIRPFSLLLLTLPAAVTLTALPAFAQTRDTAPTGYRSAPPLGSWFFNDDDDDDAPVRGRRVQQQVQQLPPPAAPDRMMSNDSSNPSALPPPGIATQQDGRGTYGHQLDARPSGMSAPGTANPNDVVVRPPAPVGGAASASTAPDTVRENIPPVSQLPNTVMSLPPEDQPETGAPKELPANLKKQLVDYTTKEPAGTLIVDTANTYLYLVLGNGKALRYGIGVGRDGFTWSGTERVSRMSEWPDWHPPAEMIERQPYLPRFMAGGPGNPLGARALYLGKTLYRIHGTNQPSTIGQTVSSGCIRLINEDIEDLFSRVQTGTRVVVLPAKMPESMASAAPQPTPVSAPAPRGISSAPLPNAR